MWSFSITKYCEEHNADPQELVSQMRERVRKETDLTISAGIASNIVRPLL